MPCACESCAQHARLLGLEQAPRTRAVLRNAYRAAARLWHPDRFERDPVRRIEAEERFKRIQVACRELTEHLENPVAWPMEPVSAAVGAVAPRYTAPGHTAPSHAATGSADAPAISFGGEPGCFVAPDFSPVADRIIAAQLRDAERALAIVDLSGRYAEPGRFARFLLLADSGLFLRDERGLVCLLRYDDLGAVRLVERSRRGVAGLWRMLLERLSGREQRYRLEIWRNNASLFYTIAHQTSDRVKQILYEFLERKRPRPEL